MRKFIYGVLLAVLCLSFPHEASAHDADDLLINFEKTGESWRANIEMDVVLAIPEMRNNDDEPQPTRQWLVERSDAEHERLRVGAEVFIRESISFAFKGEPVAYELSFPDFEGTSPNFPSLLNGGAYMSLRIVGELDASDDDGDFKIFLAAGDRPAVIVSMIDQAGEIDYIIVAPGGVEVLWKQQKSGVSEVQYSGVFALLVLGYRHVVPDGLDHVFFILLLFLLCREWRPLLQQSLVFTLAHSITLGLAISGVLSMATWPSIITSLIEPFIALSIVYLALENIFRKRVSSQRVVLIFLFGLVHGLGFAGSLGSALSVSENWVLPLAMANLGVELAQVSVLAVAWILTVRLSKSERYVMIQKLCSVAIGLCALYMLIERLILNFTGS